MYAFLNTNEREDKFMKRVILIVMDSVGIGELPDAKDFGDVGTNTLTHVSKVKNDFAIPNLIKLG